MDRRLCYMMTILAAAAGARAQLSDTDLVTLAARGKTEGWTFSVGRTPATERPLSALCGLRPPDSARDGGWTAAIEPKADLPAAFDWRDYGGCPAVRDQGGCGSCWAFGTVGPLECNILIKDGIEVDLSEQWLVSCNQETTPPVLPSNDPTPSWGCNGGWFAHEYHEGTKTDSCGGSGAVLEADFPYDASELPCACPYPHAYTIDSWAFVGPELGVAEVDAIKQAILDYGPVACGLRADMAFASYTGGVLNASSSDPPNHSVVLAGWDDTQGAEGVWILRNSWTEYWGEAGYMRIEFGCSSVGFGACYVDYPGQGPPVGPAITRHPAGGQVFEGLPFEFSVEATGVGGLHYAWERNGTGVGVDSAVCPIANASPEDEGTYVCHVSDMLGTSTSTGAVLTVVPSEALRLSWFVVSGLVALLTALGVRRLARHTAGAR